MYDLKVYKVSLLYYYVVHVHCFTKMNISEANFDEMYMLHQCSITGQEERMHQVWGLELDIGLK